jgi:hypothetical protein
MVNASARASSRAGAVSQTATMSGGIVHAKRPTDVLLVRSSMVQPARPIAHAAPTRSQRRRDRVRRAATRAVTRGPVAVGVPRLPRGCPGYFAHPRRCPRFSGPCAEGCRRGNPLTAARPSPIAPGCLIPLAPRGWPEP